LKILFLSRRDAGRGPMAACIARQRLGAEHQIASAGVEPGSLHPMVAECLAEGGMQLGEHRPRVVAPEDVALFDVVVVVCERDVAGHLPRGVHKLHWPLVDPLDPPAVKAEIRARFRDTLVALDKHIKRLAKLEMPGPADRQGSQGRADR
jgi:arsenate reductase